MPRPAFQPTDEQRELVVSLVCCGIPHDVISEVIGIARNTLEKYFREELDHGKAVANAKVAGTLFKMATSGDSPASTFFWLKTQAGWRETNHHELTVSTDLEKLTPDERRELIREQQKKLLEIGKSVGSVDDLKGLPE